MEQKRPTAVTIIGATQSAISLIVALPYLIFGTYLICSDLLSMMIGAGGNLSGVPSILGTIMIGTAAFLLFGFISALLLLKLNQKGRRRIVIFITLNTIVLPVMSRMYLGFISSLPGWLPYYYSMLLKPVVWCLIGINLVSLLYLNLPSVKQQFTEAEGLSSGQRKNFIAFVTVTLALALFFAIHTVISTKNIGPEEAGRREVEALRRNEEKNEAEILKQFEKSTVLGVKFNLRYLDEKVRRAVGEKSHMAKKDAYNQFVIENIINPIGPADVPRFRTGNEITEYVVEITKSGYKKLKNNPYIFGITLWKY